MENVVVPERLRRNEGDDSSGNALQAKIVACSRDGVLSVVRLPAPFSGLAFKTRVTLVQRKSRVTGGSFGKKDLQTEIVGWFIGFEGSYESIYVGQEEPNFKVGQEVVVTIE